MPSPAAPRLLAHGRWSTLRAMRPRFPSPPTPLVLATLLIACGAQPVPRPVDPQPTAAPAAVEQRLASGLRWTAERTPGAPAVAVQLWLPAGALLDPDAHPGTAALAASTVGLRLDAALAPFGGRAEGWARSDASAIALTVAPDRLKVALDALARIIDSPPSAAETEAARARFAAQLVTAGRSADRRALRRLRAVAWGTHPAARPLLGIEVPPADAVEAWRAAHHRPKGAVLIVAGDVEAPGAVVAAALGGWTGAPKTQRWTAPTWPAEGPLVEVDERGGERAAIRLAWPVPAAAPADVAAADVLALSLVDGPDAPIPAALARAGVEAQSAAFVYAPGPDGMLVVAVDVPAELMDDAWRALAEATAHIRRHPPGRARQARAADELESVRARAFADPEALAAHLGPRILRWSGAGRAASAEYEASVALARTLTAERLVAWIGAPLPAGLDGASWGKQLAGAFTAEEAPERLASGFTGVAAQVVPRPGSGVVALTVRSAGGAATVPSDMLGAAHLAAAALAAPLPGLGRPRVTLAPDALTVTLTVPAERFSEAAGALFDRLLRPEWTGERIENARAEALAALESAAPLVEAERLLVAELARFGGAPSAEPEAVQAGLEIIPPARVAAWFDGFVTHGPLRVVAVGEVDEAALYRALAAAVPAERPGVRMQPLRPPVAAADGVQRTDRRVDGAEAAWGIGWTLGELDDQTVAALEVALALVARGAALDGAPLTVRTVTESGSGHVRAGLVIGGPPAAVRAAVPRIFAQLDLRRKVSADADMINGAIRWLEGRRVVGLADAAAFGAWVAEQAEAGRAFGPRALPQWRAAIERARAPLALAAARDLLTAHGRFEVWIGPGRPPETPAAPPPAPAPASTEDAR